MNLIEYLKGIPDFRRKEGQRYSNISMLLIIIMAMLRGKYCYREIGRFCQSNKKEIIKIFGFRNGRVPSHVSIRTFVLNTDFVSIQQAFYNWTQSHVAIEEGEWIHIDGKSIRSTLSDYETSYQNFVSLVSLFASRTEKVLYSEKMENKKVSEIKVVENLLDVLELKDVILTLDALHCKKNS